MKCNSFNHLPISSFYIETKPSVNGVSRPFGAFFQKDHLSIPLQIIILNILKNDNINIETLRHPISPFVLFSSFELVYLNTTGLFPIFAILLGVFQILLEDSSVKPDLMSAHFKSRVNSSHMLEYLLCSYCTLLKKIIIYFYSMLHYTI